MEAQGSTHIYTDKRKQLKLKLTDRVRKQAQARERGANPASRKRDLDFVKCSLMNIWLVDTGSGYDLVSKRESAMIKRFVNKAQAPITFQSARGPTRRTLRSSTSKSWTRTSHHNMLLQNTSSPYRWLQVQRNWDTHVFGLPTNLPTSSAMKG